MCDLTLAMSAICLLLCVPTNANTRAAIDYYVAPTGNDGGPGTQIQPWRTIQHSAELAGPGATVHVAPGTYNETVWIRTSGTANAPITYLSERKWGAHIVGTTLPPAVRGANYKPAVDIRGGYVTFQGFAVSAPYGYAGIVVTGAKGVASHDQIIGNDVYDVAGPCKLGKCSPRHILGGCGICLSNTIDNLNHNDDAIGNLVHDIGDPLNPQGADLVHGIYVELGGDLQYPNQGSYSARVQNNVVYRIEGDGITSWHCVSHEIITNNTIVAAANHGILLSASTVNCRVGPKDKPNSESVVANNIVVRSGWHDGCGQEAIRAHRCFRTSASGGCGIVVFHATRTRILNNLSNDNRCHGSNNGMLALSDPATAADRVSNNIVDRKPLFVNYRADGSGDFHLQPGSPAIDRGTSLDAPGTDFDGVHRPQGLGYDIGAYEYLPEP